MSFVTLPVSVPSTCPTGWTCTMLRQRRQDVDPCRDAARSLGHLPGCGTQKGGDKTPASEYQARDPHRRPLLAARDRAIPGRNALRALKPGRTFEALLREPRAIPMDLHPSPCHPPPPAGKQDPVSTPHGTHRQTQRTGPVRCSGDKNQTSTKNRNKNISRAKPRSRPG